jgi:hypothetical protein
MSTLSVKDMSRNEEMDSDDMAAIEGGRMMIISDLARARCLSNFAVILDRKGASSFGEAAYISQSVRFLARAVDAHFAGALRK